MFKQLRRQPWICARCLHKQRSSKRGLVGLATAQQPFPDLPVASHGAPAAVEDDITLRRIFDSLPFWREFSSRQLKSTTGRKTGLLHNRYLTSPQGFQAFAKDALHTSQKIVAKILAASSVEEYRSLVTDFDRLSDQLCRVIDLVEFIRNVHPSPQTQHAAMFAHSQMYEYMNVLNTTPGLNDQLTKAASMSEVTSQWTQEEEITAEILLKDFAQSAISGSEAARERFVQLSNEIVQVGNAMAEDMSPECQSLQFPSSKLQGMDPVAVKKITSWGTSKIPTHGNYAQLALRTVHDPEVRRQLYTGMRTADHQSIRNVERLVQARAELAHLSGHASFGHMALTDKMAQSPEAVSRFLEALAANNKPHVQADLEQLLKIRNEGTQPGDSANQMNGWDRDYYTTRLRTTSKHAMNRPSEILAPYFSLGTVMQGLSRLFSHLYGIRLVPHENQPGETWNDDVRRLDVIDEVDGHIAVIYCDLFERPNKSPNPAHFTLRCSREISASEIADAHASGSLPPDPTLDDLSDALNDGMALNFSPPLSSTSASTSTSTQTRTLHQLPTIGFICDFPRPPSRSTPTLLSFTSLTTLYHEMGHCLHSLLGRTRLQNVAGTRCATDFAELPSILMEHFAADPAVLGLYARHWETDKPLNVDLVAMELEREREGRSASETESQILLSALDQAFHSPAVPGRAQGQAESGQWSSTPLYHTIYTSPLFTTTPEPPGTSWHGFFGHLYQYGGVYYSYLFDRAIANQVFNNTFKQGRDGGALGRENGERYKREVLAWGGSRGGWECVAGVLGEGEYGWMKGGGRAAMEEVGRWGTGGLGGGGGGGLP